MFCLKRGVKDKVCSISILRIRKKDSLLNRGKKGEADRTGIVNATFVLVFTKHLIVIRCLMKFILIRG